MSTREEEHAAAGDSLLGTVLAGRYRIEELIGSGGMGAVYRAEHVHMRKAVAVKVLHREMSGVPEVVARFEREAVAAGRIEHPHVVSASDFGQLDDGTFYLALEFVEGHSLSKLVAKEGSLPPERALRIARQIAEALSAAHRVGIVHRDLKPDNVMLVAKEGDQDYVKVLDFGIAKVKVDGITDQPALTQIGTVFGTPEYMSPEQARGEHVDARADVYTVGVILYEMLAGISPFKDEDLVVVLTRHLTADPPPLPRELDPTVQDLVLLLLQKNPAQRVQTAEELIQRIDLILGAPSSLGSLGLPSSGTMSRARAIAPASAGPVTARDMTPVAGDAPTLLGPDSPRATSRGLWRRHVQVGRRRVPAWLVGAGALGSILGVAGLIVSGSLLFGNDSAARAATGDTVRLVKPQEQQLAELIARAEAGDQTALAEITARPQTTRGRREWQALGHGYAKLGHFSASLAGYQGGLAAHPGLAKDTVLLADVRLAALDAQVSDEALKLAATGLGSPGVDLVYDVWDDTRSVPSEASISKRARAYLDDDSVRAKASPRLGLVLDLSKAQKEGCTSVKRWLARASAEGDARVAPLLKRFDDRRGCGFLGLGDCYSCLRASKDLANTADSVASRPAPHFTAP